MTEEKKLRHWISKTAQDMAQNKEVGSWAYYFLDCEYEVMLEWLEGYDSVSDNFFLYKGHNLEVSIRTRKGQFFECDNSYPVINQQGDVLEGMSLQSYDLKDNFKLITDYILSQYKFLLKLNAVNAA